MKNPIIKIVCKHEKAFVRRIYGDEINAVSGKKIKRKEYQCIKCGKYFYE